MHLDLLDLKPQLRSLTCVGHRQLLTRYYFLDATAGYFILERIFYARFINFSYFGNLVRLLSSQIFLQPSQADLGRKDKLILPYLL